MAEARQIPTIAGLLGKILETHAQLDAALATLTLPQFTQPGVEGDWSVKDILSHLAFWEERMLSQLDAARRGEKPTPAIQPGQSWADTIDRLNAENYQLCRDRSLPEVLARHGQVFGQVLATTAALCGLDDTERRELEATLGESVSESFEGDSYGHYPEHAASIRSWQAAQAPAF